MTKIFILVFVLLSLISCFFAAETNVEQKDIVQANHFYSSSNKEKLYNIGSLKKGKLMALILKSPEGQQAKYPNLISIQINIGSVKQTCKFKSLNDICVIDSIEEEKGSMTIKCEGLPCEATWKIIQPQVQELADSEHISKFYTVSTDDPRKMHLNIICPSLQISDISSLFKVYSEMDHIRFDNQRQSYILFPNPTKSHIYFQMAQELKDCASLKVDRLPKAISSQVTSDLILSSSPTLYSLSDLPDNNFRIDAGLHMIAPSRSDKNDLIIKITGEKSGTRQTIRQNTIILDQSSKTFDFSYAVPQIKSQYSKIQLQISTNMAGVLLDFNTGTQSKQLVQSLQFSYFDLKKGEKLDYQLVKQEKIQTDKKVTIILFDEKKIMSDKKNCDIKTGCQFQIQALEDAKGYIYLGIDGFNGPSTEIVILQMGKDKSFTKKVKEGQKVYLKKNISKDKAIQVLINSGNVMVYMAPKSKCEIPSKECFSKIATLQRHFIYVPTKDEETQIIFLIDTLDNCEFTLTIIDQEGSAISLKDSQPFAYLMDSQEDEIKFVFTRQNKVDMSFNLVAPLHALDLMIVNDKKMSKDIQDVQVSSEGFLQFLAKQAPNSYFSIVVKKRQNYQQKFVHFVIIASSKGKEVRLQSGITYYETLSKSEDNNAEYVFEFDSNQDYVLNFYSHNVKEEKVKIYFQLSSSNDWSDKQAIIELEIERASDVLDLSDISEKLCIKSGEGSKNCELFMRMQNKMGLQIDIAITLMTRQAIIQMHTGVWQSFSLNTVAKTAHFYFQPKNKDQDVSIFFKTTDTNTRVMYNLYAGSYDNINPTQWPFPVRNEGSKLQKKFSPPKHMSISKKSLEICWPYCVVLMSIIELEQNKVDGDFKLMVSDSITQIPQKQKFDIVLSTDEQKIYLVDLKYAIDQDKNVYFYTYHSMGVTNIFANIYSEKNDRVPDEDQSDFQLNSQTMIPIDKIKEIIEDESMDEHNNIYLYIVISAITDSKLSLQFSFDEEDTDKAKLITSDTFEHLSLKQKSNQVYYVMASQPFEIKIIRESGFPFLYTLNCKLKFDQCLSKIQEEETDGLQIITKVSANTAVPCSQCVYFFKLVTKQDPTSLQIHLQSSTAQIELAESKPVYDFTEKEQSNKYILYAIRGEQIFINVDVTEGEVEVQVTDLHRLNIQKSGKQLIAFNIPTQAKSSQQQSREKKNQQFEAIVKQSEKSRDQLSDSLVSYMKQNGFASQNYLSAFGLSEKFIVLHIQVKSKDEEKQSIYTISYSSGDREFEIQDGLIVDYELQSEKQSTFYYSTKHKGHAYLLISMEKTQYLKDLDIKLKYCESKDEIIDEDCWIEFKSDKPPMKDKTPNPTIMYSLPSYNYFAFTLEYSGSKSQKVTLGVNHQQVILLPMDRQFPFVLHAKEDLVLLTEISNPGNIYVTIRKCDDSNPTFSYTFNYDDFQEGQFLRQQVLNDSPKSESYMKVKPGTMYMKFNSPEEQSILSIMIKFSEKKTKQTTISAGGKGQMDYSIIDSTNAEISLRPPVCADGSCSGKIKYYLMTTTKKRDLYTQLVCPSNFFNSYQAVAIDPIKQEQITPKQNSDGSLSLKFKLADQISYVGVKAIDKNGRQIYYKPMQIATIWGQLSRTSHLHKWAIFSFIICALLSLVIFVRRSSRAGYRPIDDQM